MKIKGSAVLALVVLAGCASTPRYFTSDGQTWYHLTEDPADPVGWVAEFRPKVHAMIGIPYGPMPVDHFFTTREACEEARTKLTFKSGGLARIWSSPEVPPSEPCREVHYRIEQKQ